MATSVLKQRELLTFGFIREYIQNQKLKLMIPLPVIDLCAEFYQFFEYVDFSVFDENVFEREVDDERSIQTLKFKDPNDADKWRAFYGGNAYEKGVHSWKLKCIKYGGNWADGLGVSHERPKTDWIGNAASKKSYYLFNGYFFEIVNGSIVQQINYRNQLNVSEALWQEEDELIFTLDFDASKLEIIRQRNETEDVSFEIQIDATKKYYPCLGLDQGVAVYQALVS